MSMRIQVNGSDVAIDFEDILTDPEATTLADWGNKLGLAERELAQADIAYRGWRAREGGMLTDGKKSIPSEWKVKQKLEAMPNFATFKNGIADAHYNVRLLTTIVDALKLRLAELATKLGAA